jgi:hypothetical protein
MQGPTDYYSSTDLLSAIGFKADPGDIYYLEPPIPLTSYKMYIDNPQKKDKALIGSYISYTMSGTDISDKLNRRYSEFYSLYEKLLQRWPGVYIPKVPHKILINNKDTVNVKIRMRLLNRFCLNLSKIDYLYKSEEVNIFKNNIPEVTNAIEKLPNLTYGEILARMKEAFPNANESYDIILGKSKINEFDQFLKKTLKNLEIFRSSVISAMAKKEVEKNKYLDLVKGFSEYEKLNMMSYADNSESKLIFFNPSYSNLSEKVMKLNTQMINPYSVFKDWLDEDILDCEAMIEAIKRINQMIETVEKLKRHRDSLDLDIKQLESGQSGFLKSIKSIFKKKEVQLSEKSTEMNLTIQKIDDLEKIINIVSWQMEERIEEYKKEKTYSYYKYLKTFAILQRESNKIIRELWKLVKEALNDVCPEIIKGFGGEEEKLSGPVSDYIKQTKELEKPEESEPQQTDEPTE